MTKPLIIIISLFCFHLAVAQNNSFQGTFTNAQTGLTITLQQSGEGYSGQFGVQGQVFQVTARQQGADVVSGTYPYYGNNVPLEINRTPQGYVLKTEGMVLPLEFTPDGVASSPKGALSNTSAPPAAASTPVSRGGKKAGGSLIKDETSGFAFRMPSGWKHQQLEDGSYVGGHDTKAGFIMVMPHEVNELNTLRQEASQGIVEEGIAMYPAGQIQGYGNNGLYAEYTGTMQGQQAKVHAIGLISAHGGGLTVLVGVSAQQHTDEYLDLAKSVANSMTFQKPKTSPVVGQWQEKLRGMRLQYLYTGNGISDNITIDLCMDGYFYYNDNSSYFSPGATADFSSVGQNKGAGSWKVSGRGQTVYLILNYHDGSRGEYTLEPGESSGKIQMNGKRYFVVERAACN